MTDNITIDRDDLNIIENETQEIKCVKPLGIDENLIYTSNSLSDIIGWLGRDAYVVIHSHDGRYFHKCDGKEMTDEEVNNYINTHRFIYVNVSRMPELLDDGEWEWYIQNAGFDECKCKIKEKALYPGLIVHKTMTHKRFRVKTLN